VDHGDLAVGRSAGSHSGGDGEPAAAAARDDDRAAAPGDLRGELEALLRTDEVERDVDLAVAIRREDAVRGVRAREDAAVGAELGREIQARARSTSTGRWRSPPPCT
jgi:hypothetical protein